MPVKDWSIHKYYDYSIRRQIVKPGEVANGRNPVSNWDIWTKELPKTVSKPQEPEILGSLTVDFCTFSAGNWPKSDPPKYSVSPFYLAYRNSLGFWRNYQRVGMDFPGLSSIQLPKGCWLICGDRVWHSIPSHLEGGPCRIGRHTVAAPSAKVDLKKKHEEKGFAYQYDKNFKSNFMSWNAAKRVSAGLFLTQLASALETIRLSRVLAE